MGKAKQLWLPKVKRIKQLEKIRQSPQPHVDEFRSIKQFEIFHRPFDLRFRGRVNLWLEQVKKNKAFKLGDLLDKEQMRIVNLYFFPQKPENKWLTQNEVLERVKEKSKKRLKLKLVSSLVRIWKKDRR